MNRKTLLGTAAAVAATITLSGVASARDQIQVVGSSTVFPFSTAVAEKFGQMAGMKAPVVESTGTGGGIKLFCSGVGENTPDIANASRRIKDTELKTCTDNGVTPIEVKIGFDGIVLASAASGTEYKLTKEQIFDALAKTVVKDGKSVANPNKTWADIDPSLPAEKIEILGPPPTSGTRDAFVELVMTEACPKEIKDADAKVCSQIREDGAFVEAGENDNLIVQKLEANPKAVGIFGYSFLDQNAEKLKAHRIDDVDPTFENIAGGQYPVARSLYFYIKKEHLDAIPGLKEFAAEFVSEAAAGESGYLTDKGLIPLPASDLKAQEEAVTQAKPVSM